MKSRLAGGRPLARRQLTAGARGSLSGQTPPSDRHWLSSTSIAGMIERREYRRRLSGPASSSIKAECELFSLSASSIVVAGTVGIRIDEIKNFYTQIELGVFSRPRPVAEVVL